jgi:hypothetical protein
MLNYLLWHQHREVEPAVADESDGNDDIDWMYDMVSNIGRGYDMKSKDPPQKVQNFYRLLTTSEEKIHDGTDLTVLQDNCMIFYKEHKNEPKCLKCDKPRFIDVVNEHGEKVMTKTAQKQLHYMPLMP